MRCGAGHESRKLLHRVVVCGLGSGWPEHPREFGRPHGAALASAAAARPSRVGGMPEASGARRTQAKLGVAAEEFAKWRFATLTNLQPPKLLEDAEPVAARFPKKARGPMSYPDPHQALQRPWSAGARLLQCARRRLRTQEPAQQALVGRFAGPKWPTMARCMAGAFNQCLHSAAARACVCQPEWLVEGGGRRRDAPLACGAPRVLLPAACVLSGVWPPSRTTTAAGRSPTWGWSTRTRARAARGTRTTPRSSARSRSHDARYARRECGARARPGTVGCCWGHALFARGRAGSRRGGVALAELHCKAVSPREEGGGGDRVCRTSNALRRQPPRQSREQSCQQKCRTAALCSH